MLPSLRKSVLGYSGGMPKNKIGSGIGTTRARAHESSDSDGGDKAVGLCLDEQDGALSLMSSSIFWYVSGNRYANRIGGLGFYLSYFCTCTLLT